MPHSTPTQGSTPAGRSTSTSSVGAFAHATASPEFADPYIDPKTGLLRNLISGANQDELNTKEAELTALAAIEDVRDPDSLGDGISSWSETRRRVRVVMRAVVLSATACNTPAVVRSSGGIEFCPASRLRSVDQRIWCGP